MKVVVREIILEGFVEYLYKLVYIFSVCDIVGKKWF